MRFFNFAKVGLCVSAFAMMGSAQAWDVTPFVSATQGGSVFKMIPPLTIKSGTVDTGFGAGALTHYSLMPMLELETGIHYFSEGGNFTVSNIPVTATLKAKETAHLTLSYVRIPVLVHYQFLPMFSAGGGVYYARGVGKIKGSATETIGPKSISLDVNESWSDYGLNSNDFGLMFDVNTEVPVTPGIAFYASLKYAYGLVDLAKSSNALPNQSFNSCKEMDFSLIVGSKVSI